jgi:ribonuclease-3
MSEIAHEQLLQCASIVGHNFSNIELLRAALVHRSWHAEHGGDVTNERLEFLGDAVLGWVVADLAYHRLAQDAEGRLTDLRRSVVNMNALADLARAKGIGEFLLLGRGEDAAGGREKSSILADAFEAIIGAVYLDAGYSAAFEYVQSHLAESIEEAIPHLDTFDTKTRLQELCARTGHQAPVYAVEGEGPDHERIFTARVLVNQREWGSGVGRTKKAAEQLAAAAAYDALVANDNA